MWRAFFFAVGTMLIILGFECLVVDQFEVANSTRIPPIVARMLAGEQPAAEVQPGYSQPNVGNLGSSAPQRGSQFGPSRFNDSPFNSSLQTNQNYYGGTPNSVAGQQPVPQFSLTGFGSSTSQPGIMPVPAPDTSAVSSPRSSRIVHPEDWMPWSLLAAGTLVVLYTNTTSRRAYSND